MTDMEHYNAMIGQAQRQYSDALGQAQSAWGQVRHYESLLTALREQQPQRGSGAATEQHPERCQDVDAAVREGHHSGRLQPPDESRVIDAAAASFPTTSLSSAPDNPLPPVCHEQNIGEAGIGSSAPDPQFAKPSEKSSEAQLSQEAQLSTPQGYNTSHVSLLPIPGPPASVPYESLQPTSVEKSAVEQRPGNSLVSDVPTVQQQPGDHHSPHTIINPITSLSPESETRVDEQVASPAPETSPSQDGQDSSLTSSCGVQPPEMPHVTFGEGQSQTPFQAEPSGQGVGTHVDDPSHIINLHPQTAHHESDRLSSGSDLVGSNWAATAHLAGAEPMPATDQSKREDSPKAISLRDVSPVLNVGSSGQLISDLSSADELPVLSPGGNLLPSHQGVDLLGDLDYSQGNGLI